MSLTVGFITIICTNIYSSWNGSVINNNIK